MLGKNSAVHKDVTAAEAEVLLSSEPDFVNLKRFGYSLRAALRRYPDGCPDHIIAQALMIDESCVTTLYDSIVAKLRGLIGVDRDRAVRD